MVSGSAVALAREMASRRETLPSAGLTTSAKVVTEMVAGIIRSSKASNRSPHARVRGLLPAPADLPNHLANRFFTFDSVLRIQRSGISQVIHLAARCRWR